MHSLTLIDILARTKGIAVIRLTSNEVNGLLFQFFKKLIWRNLTGAPKTLGLDTFPDPISRFGAPLEAILYFAALQAVRVPPVSLGWYSSPNLFSKSFLMRPITTVWTHFQTLVAIWWPLWILHCFKQLESATCTVRMVFDSFFPRQ